MPNYADRLEAAIARTGNPCLVGLDPHPQMLPDEFAAVRTSTSRAERAEAAADFLCQIVDLVAGAVPAVKPQSALFEIHGTEGAAAWERVVRAARSAELLVLGDVKRGDIDSTARAYASAFLGDPDGAARDRDAVCDAITINPYLGTDSVKPFLDACARTGGGVYVLVRTSNPGGGLFQEHGTPPLYEKVADAVVEWGRPLVGRCGLSSVGAVVGATRPSELAQLRSRKPSTPVLIPGYGAQGGGAGDVAGGFLAGGRGALVNSSRGILFAWREARFSGMHWKDASRAALAEMIEALSAAAATNRT
jgi:orotidine-5'-phosphate decarboxylase